MKQVFVNLQVLDQLLKFQLKESSSSVMEQEPRCSTSTPCISQSSLQNSMRENIGSEAAAADPLHDWYLVARQRIIVSVVSHKRARLPRAAGCARSTGWRRKMQTEQLSLARAARQHARLATARQRRHLGLQTLWEAANTSGTSNHHNVPAMAPPSTNVHLLGLLLHYFFTNRP
jgi:hypothetical protein